MALVTQSSRCAICGLDLAEIKPAALPPFVRNTKDRLYILSGRVFHPACLANHPLVDEARSAILERKARMRGPVFICRVCKEPITEEGCTTDLMTTDAQHPLASFNYLHFHRDHFAVWPDRSKFDMLVEQARRDGTWEGDPTVRLLT